MRGVAVSNVHIWGGLRYSGLFSAYRCFKSELVFISLLFFITASCYILMGHLPTCQAPRSRSRYTGALLRVMLLPLMKHDDPVCKEFGV